MGNRILSLLIAAIIGFSTTTFPLAQGLENQTTANNSFDALMENSGEKFSKSDTQKIHETITTFLYALRMKRPDIAGSLVSTQMKRQFKGPTAMMKMMTRVHLPIVSAHQLFMHEPQHRDGYIVQTVYFRAIDNTPWKAAYFLNLDADGNLGISGCHIKRVKGQLI